MSLWVIDMIPCSGSSPADISTSRGIVMAKARVNLRVSSESSIIDRAGKAYLIASASASALPNGSFSSIRSNWTPLTEVTSTKQIDS